jgi:hypothetical protein
MYVPEPGMKETLRATATAFAARQGAAAGIHQPGRTRTAEKYPSGVIKNAFDWREPFVFGVPDGQDREFFRDTGLEMDDAGREQAARVAATSGYWLADSTVDGAA